MTVASSGDSRRVCRRGVIGRDVDVVGGQALELLGQRAGDLPEPDGVVVDDDVEGAGQGGEVAFERAGEEGVYGAVCFGWLAGVLLSCWGCREDTDAVRDVRADGGVARFGEAGCAGEAFALLG